MAELLNNALSKNFIPSDNKELKDLEKQFRIDMNHEEYLTYVIVSQQDVLDSINESKSSNSSGEDGITSFILKR